MMEGSETKAAASPFLLKPAQEEVRGFDIDNSLKEMCVVSELILLTHGTALLPFSSVSGHCLQDLTQSNCQPIVTLAGNHLGFDAEVLVASVAPHFRTDSFDVLLSRDICYLLREHACGLVKLFPDCLLRQMVQGIFLRHHFIWYREQGCRQVQRPPKCWHSMSLRGPFWFLPGTLWQQTGSLHANHSVVFIQHIKGLRRQTGSRIQAGSSRKGQRDSRSFERHCTEWFGEKQA